ncbi:MAG TPA: PAS domain S-box protein, partial [Candidatus Wallbacteria bacterium]|nr:PAS domain S-box protein [Candidatus Wallbacteria bacterium]
MEKVRGKILIIEDNPGDVSLLKTYLSSFSGKGDWHIDVAATLSDAVALAGSAKYAVILLDLTLPDSEGIRTVNSTVAFAPETPIIVLTGVSDEETGIKAMQAGAQDYLIKGQFDPKMLVRSIRYATERHRLRMELEMSIKHEAEISEARYQAIMKLENEINEHRATEAKLNHKTAEMQAVFGVIPDLYFRVDSEGVIVDYKAAQEEELYLPPKDFLGRKYRDIMPADVADLTSNAIEDLKKNRSMVIMEYSIPLKNTEAFFEARLLPLFDNEVIFLIRNITERKISIEKILQSEKKYRDLADSLPQTIFETDEKGTLKFVNKAAFAHFEYTMKDFEKGLNVFQMIHGQERERAIRKFGAMVSKQPDPDNSNEYIALKKTGTPFCVSIHSTPIIGSEGRVNGIRGIIIDITDKKRAEEQLAAEKERLAVTL